MLTRIAGTLIFARKGAKSKCQRTSAEIFSRARASLQVFRTGERRGQVQVQVQNNFQDCIQCNSLQFSSLMPVDREEDSERLKENKKHLGNDIDCQLLLVLTVQHKMTRPQRFDKSPVTGQLALDRKQICVYILVAFQDYSYSLEEKQIHDL